MVAKLGVSLTLLLAASATEASPWVLPPGRVAVGAGANYQFANSEFFFEPNNGMPIGGELPFSLNGQYHGASFYTSLRAGVFPRFEFELNVPFRVVSYTADPVILVPRPMGTPGFEADYYRRNIIDLTRAVAGIADINVSLRYQLVRPPFPLVISAELKLKMPTGYQGPSGTFGDNPTSAADFVARAGELVNPQNVRDDVTLGDGQLDVSPSLLMGMALRSGTFFRLDAGFNFRTAGAGQQLNGSFRVGQSIGRTLILYGGISGLYTFTRGRVIGISVAAIDPTVPAADYGRENNPFYNLLLREVRLERDQVDLSGGFIIRINPTTELNFSYGRTVAGRNVAASHSVNLSVSAATDWGTAPTTR
ncbi:MAG: hypothetical protein Q8Q09_29600 [Deltaproteobacteria bacterium]|nr:hypothetical protein [Deltaproteobacteria bacterium]